MKRISVLLVVAAFLAMGIGAAQAGTTAFGITGLIDTPDDNVAQMGKVSLGGLFVNDYDGAGVDFSFYGAVAGILPRFEVGGAVIDTDAAGVDSQGILNAKYKVLDETLTRPGIAVGFADITKGLDKLGVASDTTAYVVFGKNLTSVAESVTGSVCKPLRGTLGFGSGLYKGVFAGLNWSASSKLDIMADFLTGDGDSTFNAGVKYAAFKGLSLEVGAFDTDNVYFGANYNISSY